MIEFDKPFYFNRKYIKEVEREQVNYSWGNVLQDFFSVLKNLPVQKSELWYEESVTFTDKETGEEKVMFEGMQCHNLYEQLIFLQGPLLEDGEDSKYKGFLASYATMFFIMKNYTDDELSYLYITGMEFINPWYDAIEEPRKLLDKAYTQNIVRKTVIEILAKLLVISILNDAAEYFEQVFYLEDYEEEEFI